MSYGSDPNGYDPAGRDDHLGDPGAPDGEYLDAAAATYEWVCRLVGQPVASGGTYRACTDLTAHIACAVFNHTNRGPSGSGSRTT